MNRSRVVARIAALLMTFASFLVVGLAPSQAQFGLPAAPKDVLSARATLDKGALKAGQSALLQIRLSVREPFHVNANPASADYLIATQVIVPPRPGLIIGTPIYPQGTPKKFSFFDKPLSVYQGTVTVKVPLRAGASFKAQPINGIVKYQACNDQSCLPPKQTTFSTAATTATAPQSTLAPQIGGATSNEVDAAATALRTRFGVQGIPQLVFLDGAGRERSDLRAGEEVTLPTMTRKLAALHSGERLAIEKSSAGGFLGRLEKLSLGAQLLLVFLGGLALNLTPCVYPMIPITVGYFGAQSEGRAGKTFGLALLYVLGLAIMYSSLGVFAALTGGLFGAVLQSPLAVGFVAIVLFALSLSMFGVFTLQPPQFVMARSGAKKGAMGALAMGALLGIVAAPCVGPIVAALLTIVGARRDVFLGFILFLSLSLGLGLPYLLLGTFSGAVKSLPRSGAWLEKSKKFFAVPLLIAALYYGYSAVRQALPAQSTLASSSVVRNADATEISSNHSAVEAHWSRATTLALAQARRDGRPVVLDFRADWCLPCLKLEREVFERPEMNAAAKNVLLLRADYTRAGQ